MSQLRFNISILLVIILTSIVIAKDSMAAAFPFYDEESKILMLPRVDTANRINSYYGALFFYNEETDEWIFQGANPTQDDDISIDEVTITITDTFPTQVFLHITGTNLFCNDLAQINQRLKDNVFEILVSTVIGPTSVPRTACNQPFGSFVRVVPLPIFGLDAGTYEYNVNDKVNGTFNLLEDNRFVQ